MNGRVTQQAWRWSAVALFCGLPVLLATILVAQLAQIGSAQDETTRQDALARQIVDKLSMRPQRDLTASEKASLYLDARRPSLAAAEMQDRAAKLVSAAGGRLVEAQLIGDAEHEQQGQVCVHLTLDIDNKGLIELVYAAETGLPLVTVTAVDVATQSDGPGASPGVLRVGLTLAGRFRREG